MCRSFSVIVISKMELILSFHVGEVRIAAFVIVLQPAD